MSKKMWVVRATAKKLKHDKYIEDLHDRLKPNYDVITTNIPLYSKKKRKIAEIDVLAEREDTCDAFEVKCSYRPVKAKKQLRKIRKLVPKVKRTYFFCGESGAIEIIKN
ncbi:MAG: hypothetical protein ISS25_02790 [Nanoarchaeota archaeon]|nr:hypothetical protein [DPANN group archaeon]MBL7116730.1 hypothetical protein [Nanoarchaeota archaeon]